MDQAALPRSKAFKEKENVARENVRSRNEQALVGDLTRLLEEKVYCDVTFVVENQEFPAHVAVLRARAPKFCQQFLPGLLSPEAVQSCICIQNLPQEEFSAFLKSVYTENNACECPWRERVSLIYPSHQKDVPQQHNESVNNGMNDSIEDSIEEDSIDQSKQEQNLIESDCTNGSLEEGSLFLKNASTESSTKTEAPRKQDYRLLYQNCVTQGCCRLGTDLLTLIDDCSSADITFSLNGTVKIRAHRAILCARSNYFSAMLYGGWSEKEATEIPLPGVSPAAFVTVLQYLYGGITSFPCEPALICDLLPLADMYCLDGLKDVIKWQLRIESCHLFHKPCMDCIAGVLESLEISEMFSFPELKQSCIRWITKYFDRVLNSKCFAVLSKPLQDEVLVDMQNSLSILTAIDMLKRTDSLQFNTPRIKWAEPIHVVLSTFMENCLDFIAAHIPAIVLRDEFLKMMKGVGWSAPLLEKIFTTVRNTLGISNCCEAYKIAIRLSLLLNEETESDSNEEICGLVEKLRRQCEEYITSNLHRVSHTEEWSHLSPRMQSELRKSQGASRFYDVGTGGSGRKPNNLSLSGPTNHAASLPKGRNSSGATAKGHSYTLQPRSLCAQGTRSTSARNSRDTKRDGKSLQKSFTDSAAGSGTRQDKKGKVAKDHMPTPASNASQPGSMQRSLESAGVRSSVTNSNRSVKLSAASKQKTTTVAPSSSNANTSSNASLSKTLSSSRAGYRNPALDGTYITDAIDSAKRITAASKASSTSASIHDNQVRVTQCGSNTSAAAHKRSAESKTNSTKGRPPSGIVMNTHRNDKKDVLSNDQRASACLPSTKKTDGNTTSSSQKVTATNKKSENAEHTRFYDNRSSRLRAARSASSLSSSGASSGSRESLTPSDDKRKRSNSQGQVAVAIEPKASASIGATGTRMPSKDKAELPSAKGKRSTVISKEKGDQKKTVLSKSTAKGCASTSAAFGSSTKPPVNKSKSRVSSSKSVYSSRDTTSSFAVEKANSRGIKGKKNVVQNPPKAKLHNDKPRDDASVTTDDAFASVTTDDAFASVTTDDAIASVTTDDAVASVTTDDALASVTTDDAVASVTTDDAVASVTTDDAVASVTTDDAFASVTLMEDTVASVTLTDDGVASVTTDDALASVTTDDAVASVTTDDAVVTHAMRALTVSVTDDDLRPVKGGDSGRTTRAEADTMATVDVTVSLSVSDTPLDMAAQELAAQALTRALRDLGM